MISAQRLVTISVTKAIPRTRRTYVRKPCFRRKGTAFWVCSPSTRPAALESWDKFVSCAVDCQQVFGVRRIYLQLLPQLQDLIIHSPRGWIGVVSPNLVEQDFTREHALRILCEEF